VGESYPFGTGDRCLLTHDNHDSVNGIREFAHAHGASVTHHEIIRDATGEMPNTMRISLGLASNFADVYRFMAFAARFRDRTTAQVTSG
jgi:selenocysteine lyase/cysteine desulfurase